MELTSKVYVAGHRGLVGSAIVRNLKEKGYNNLVYRTSKELDLTDRSQVDRFFMDEKPEFIFLAAAKVGGILANNDYPAVFIRDNLMIQTNIIDAAFQNDVKKLVFLRKYMHLSKTYGSADERRFTIDWRVGTDKRTLCNCKNSRDQNVPIL